MNSLALQRISKVSDRGKRLRFGQKKEKKCLSLFRYWVEKWKAIWLIQSCLLSWIENDQSRPVIYLFNLVWTWLGGMKEHTVGLNIWGYNIEVGARRFLEGEWHLRDDACRGVLRYTHTNTHTGSALEQVLSEPWQQEYIILTQPSRREPFSLLNPLFTVHH